MVAIITPEDLRPFVTIEDAKAAAMIEDATAMAVRVAPCLTNPSKEQAALAKALIRRAVLRWIESGSSGTVTQESAGPFSRTITSSGSRGLFLPSEIRELEKICADAQPGKAFSVDTIPNSSGSHADICALNFKALYCSCGSDLNRYEGPIREYREGGF